MNASIICLGLGRDPQSPPWTEFELSDEASAMLSRNTPQLGIWDGLDGMELVAELVAGLPELVVELFLGH
jgi:hypothetical protein